MLVPHVIDFKTMSPDPFRLRVSALMGFLAISLGASGARGPVHEKLKAAGELEQACREFSAAMQAQAASPGAPVRLADAPPRLGVYSRSVLLPAGNGIRHRRMPSDAAAAAHELFAVLRAFDDEGVDTVWVEQPPPDASWDGVRDRLQRAAA